MITKAEKDELLSRAERMVTEVGGPGFAQAAFNVLVEEFQIATGVSKERARHWLAKAIRRARAPERALNADILAQPTSVIQETLASHVRKTIGHTPRGQLWQPCRRRDCDNEPVCMNCMLCEDEHCRCFD